MFASCTKKLILLLLLICSCLTLLASVNRIDSLGTNEQTPVKTDLIDSLKKELNALIDDSLKAPIYSELAMQYLKYDTIKNKEARRAFQNEAIANTLSALHFYSKYDDTTGLRESFDVLANIYHAEHKYVQAKWFIIQSNALSRAKSDNANIIASLLELSSIKTDIKDYTLAMRDLNEALVISCQNHMPKLESEVQLHYAMLYNVMKNYEKSSIAMKRHEAIDDSIRRGNETRMMAKLQTIDSLQQAKKKVYTISSKKHYTKGTALISSL